MNEAPAKTSSSVFDSTGLKPVRATRRFSVKFALATVWLVFTLALAGWWLMFGLSQLSEIQEATAVSASPETTERLKRQHFMLVSEGGVLLVLLMFGGSALLYNIRVESRRARQVEEFFASFTHDLKTSLASLRIQTESLRDEMGESNQNRLLERIMSDAGRLETQLENALLLAEADKSSLLVESVSVRELVMSLSHLWPRMKFEVRGDAVVLADRRALESIVRNIAQNSSRHGEASQFDVAFEQSESSTTIVFKDDGRGFKGDVRKLGEIFARQTGASGSGIGLYLVAKWVERMGGRAKVSSLEKGFSVALELPKNSRATVAIERKAST